MDDLEITRKCAEAMGLHGWINHRLAHVDSVDAIEWHGEYDPLHDDAQAMALVKKMRLDIEPCFDSVEGHWQASTWGEWNNGRENIVQSEDLNRAICECVARMASK